jgi:hypothetical protein
MIFPEVTTSYGDSSALWLFCLNKSERREASQCCGWRMLHTLPSRPRNFSPDMIERGSSDSGKSSLFVTYFPVVNLTGMRPNAPLLPTLVDVPCARQLSAVRCTITRTAGSLDTIGIRGERSPRRYEETEARFFGTFDVWSAWPTVMTNGT